MNAKEIYSQWTNANNLPDYLKDQLNDLGKDEKWIEDAFGQDINFGTAGMRGRLEPGTNRIRSEERRVGKECRSRWSPYH